MPPNCETGAARNAREQNKGMTTDGAARRRRTRRREDRRRNAPEESQAVA